MWIGKVLSIVLILVEFRQEPQRLNTVQRTPTAAILPPRSGNGLFSPPPQTSSIVRDRCTVIGSWRGSKSLFAMHKNYALPCAAIELWMADYNFPHCSQTARTHTHTHTHVPIHVRTARLSRISIFVATFVLFSDYDLINDSCSRANTAVFQLRKA